MKLGNAGYYCSKYGYDCYHPGFKGLTEEIVNNCKSYGIGINVWTVNDLDSLQNAIDWNLDGVITNFPKLVKQLVN